MIEEFDLEVTVTELAEYGNQRDISIEKGVPRPTPAFLLEYLERSRSVRSALEGHAVDQGVTYSDEEDVRILCAAWCREVLAYSESLKVFARRDDSTLRELIRGDDLFDTLTELYFTIRGSWSVVNNAEFLPFMRDDPRAFSRVSAGFYDALGVFEEELAAADFWSEIVDRLPTEDGSADEDDEDDDDGPQPWK